MWGKDSFCPFYLADRMLLLLILTGLSKYFGEYLMNSGCFPKYTQKYKPIHKQVLKLKLNRPKQKFH